MTPNHVFINNNSFFHTVIQQGDTIAFQPLYDKRNSLSCYQNPTCGKSGCPMMHIDGNDQFDCQGEVFKIYRRSGPGKVRAGDEIGIYYPLEPGKWFSCYQEHCHKWPCPGQPSMEHGFENVDDWYKCFGEVFRIYARGKRIGSPIRSHDHIMLYIPHFLTWVGMPGEHPEKMTCPGTHLPPPKAKYDICWGEVFQLSKFP